MYDTEELSILGSIIVLSILPALLAATAPIQQIAKMIFVVVRMRNSSLERVGKLRTLKKFRQLGDVRTKRDGPWRGKRGAGIAVLRPCEIFTMGSLFAR